jgi:hypothetical protein
MSKYCDECKKVIDDYLDHDYHCSKGEKEDIDDLRDATDAEIVKDFIYGEISDYEDDEENIVCVDEESLIFTFSVFGIERECVFRIEDGEIEIDMYDDSWQKVDGYSTNCKYFWIKILG